MPKVSSFWYVFFNDFLMLSSFQNSPLKSRVRKKKQKESKSVFPVQGAMLCGRGGVTSREEWDHDFSEDESL